MHSFNFFRPRLVLLALRPKVGKDLKRLVEDKVIKPVQFYEWAACTHCSSNRAEQFCEDMW